MRSGSITGTGGRCGNPHCHCRRAGDPGHGPYYRLTRKLEGKTVTETFSSPAGFAKTQGEVAEYHRFRELSGQLLEVNEQICELRPVEEEATSAQKKNGGSDRARGRARSRPSGVTQNRPPVPLSASGKMHFSWGRAQRVARTPRYSHDHGVRRGNPKRSAAPVLSGAPSPLPAPFDTRAADRSTANPFRHSGRSPILGRHSPPPGNVPPSTGKRKGPPQARSIGQSPRQDRGRT